MKYPKSGHNPESCIRDGRPDLERKRENRLDERQARHSLTARIASDIFQIGVGDQTREEKFEIGVGS